MNETVERIEQTTQRTGTLDRLIDRFSRSHFFHAIQASVGAIIAVFFLFLALGFPIADAFPWISFSIVIAFGTFSVANWLHSARYLIRNLIFVIYARAEATAEILTGQDFNHSGSIGDVPELPATIVEVDQRPIISNKKFPDEQQWKKRNDDGSETILTKTELTEFVKRADSVGLARRFWTGEKDSTGKQIARHKFSTGRECTREMYELGVSLIEHRVPDALDGRSNGHPGKIIDLPGILKEFKLE